ncbi:CPBP family intramembrane glutamic endopeptidase [Sphaerochaeta globosa]|uniref:Abortive infection protein n=1 Tax=Sphaerochaeta globosa (strain ATCC BAA-1886 / DSM 22777 / Buddy) TaxID=158189 RepID=F0RW59_SPHGB|nr:CPBP family intramembrane glutamic endopeptidase [Sphaerochaeta globosa]ADY13416.1 Abortive infection protein [Sphaerochaeta globosa str. Buddy]
MNRSLEGKPIAHAIFWIVLYIVIVNIGDALVGVSGITNLATSLLLTAFSTVLYRYSKKHFQPGFGSFCRADAKKALYYLPLIALAVLAYLGGIDTSLSPVDILVAILLMVNVGFLEEVLFRGYLLTAIASKKGNRRAILISGITFGFGHIVNLLRGYDASELATQIAGAIAIGLVLALLVVITKNLIPGILFHILFNIGGSITVQESSSETLLLLSIIVISVLYLLVLFRQFPKESVVTQS